MTTFNTGAYPPGCTQRDIDMAAQRYWHDDPYFYEPKCVHCDDAGCDRCCETQPVTLQDLEQIEEEQRAEIEREERRRLENEAMAEHFRKHPHG